MAFHAVILILLSTTAYLTDSRQMCFACSYVQNPTNSSRDCIYKPRSVPGQWAVRCPFKCTVNSEYDVVSKVIRAFQRQCGDGQGANRCERHSRYQMCYYTCEGHLCNDVVLGLINATNRSPSDGVSVHHRALSVIAEMLTLVLFVILFHR